MNRYKLVVLVLVVLISSGVESFGKEYEITSPDKNIRLKINIEQKILYSVNNKSKQLIKPSPISLTLSGNRMLGANPQVLQVTNRSADEKITPPVRIKSKVIDDKFNEMRGQADRGDILLVISLGEHEIYSELAQGSLTIPCACLSFDDVRRLLLSNDHNAVLRSILQDRIHVSRLNPYSSSGAAPHSMFFNRTREVTKNISRQAGKILSRKRFA